MVMMICLSCEKENSMRKYENVVSDICNTSWDLLMSRKARAANKDEFRDIMAEIEGWIGVHIIIAYMKGTRPTLFEMSRTLGVNDNVLVAPFNRLMKYGLFNPHSNVRNDPVLQGQSSPESTQNAWCILAGVAGGLTGPDSL